MHIKPKQFSGDIKIAEAEHEAKIFRTGQNYLPHSRAKSEGVEEENQIFKPEPRDSCPSSIPPFRKKTSRSR